ncbi:MAG: VOC family protein [Pseudohongiella sp.]|uniref:VOC family protein n=1 Tax=Pseudohongiella sp. TaxID=1979412 RepID=UPI0034A029AF
MSNKQGDFVWYELMTTDSAGAREFYSKILGWTYTDSSMDDLSYWLAAAQDADTGDKHEVAGFMEISPDMLKNGAQPAWVGYIGVDNTDAMVTAIKIDGGGVHVPPTDIPGVGRFAMIHDPQGVIFYIMQDTSGNHSLAFAADKPRVGHCAWNELYTTDQAGAWAFYSKHFGWTKDGEMDMGPMGTYDFIRHGGLIGAMMHKPDEQPVACWQFYFRVANIKVAHDVITANGGQVLMGPHEVPGGDQIIVGMDPTGAVFAVVGTQ